MALKVDSIQTDGTTPASPQDGEIWYDAADDKVYVHTPSGTRELVTPGSAGAGGLIGTGYIKKTTDGSTTSTSWVDLLSLTYVSEGFDLDIWAALNVSISELATAYARITVDSVAQSGGAVYTDANPGSISLLARVTGLAAGTHTIKLQWKSSNSERSVRCRPSSVPDSESASLLVNEVSV
jgi:hypothetical protein